MNIKDIVYLKDVLGEEEARKYLKADEEKIKILVEVLKKTDIKNMINTDNFNDFCNKIAYAKYGKVYARVLCAIGKFDIVGELPISYKMFLLYYIDGGYNDEDIYKQLFEWINDFHLFTNFSFNYNEHLKSLVQKEIAAANEDKITIDNFIKNGGSLEELIAVIKNCEITDFNKDTKIPVSLLETMKHEKYEVSICQIGFQVSQLSSLNLGKKTEQELLETYYAGLEQSKNNGFSTDVLVVENKPRLYKFLKSKGLIANDIENERNNESVKHIKM